MTAEDFKDIAPFDDDMFRPKLAELVEEPGFEHALRYIMPGINYPEFVEKLKKINNRDDFQQIVMLPVLKWLERETTAGISISGMENLERGKAYTIITNHRDIVLDATFLNLNFMKAGFPTTEIAIGDNLLIYDWINDLVRLNKSFIVRRNLKLTQALEAARHLSDYIHYCIETKHESIWIAQREGRAKDSNDLTQESLIKMLGLKGDGTMRENIEAVNLMPTSISYEYDPNDYLKAKEFLMKHRDPNFKKSQHDDLLSMETGLLKFKGHVHFTLGPCITPMLKELHDGLDKNEFIRIACDLIDRYIHLGYEIYPINYVAYDRVCGARRFTERYTPEQERQVVAYIDSQLAKVDAENVTAEEVEFMRKKMFHMYANPLANKLKALEESGVKQYVE